jgi:membrane fusion protein, multidrug efflux system
MWEARIKDDRRGSLALEPATKISAESNSAKQRPAGPAQKNWLRRHPYAVAALAIAALAVLAGVIIWWLHARHYESTDDAFVDARNVTISSQVTGAIINVPVTDNQLVDAGGLLVEIDPRHYQSAVAQAQAQVDH